MRRSDREITDINKIVQIISQCDVCRLALNGEDGFPYILPLNFGYERNADGTLLLYFHSATEGMKHYLIARDCRATFEMDCGHTLLSFEDRGYCTMNYESVIGRGRIDYITDDAEKIRALTLLTDRYHSSHFAFSHTALPRTSVYRLTVETLTAKRKATKGHPSK